MTSRVFVDIETHKHLSQDLPVFLEMKRNNCCSTIRVLMIKALSNFVFPPNLHQRIFIHVEES